MGTNTDHWDRQRVEQYASQILNAFIANPMASEELIAIGMNADEDDEDSTSAHEWAEQWADIAFDIAEVFVAEANQRDSDPANRLLEPGEDDD